MNKKFWVYFETIMLLLWIITTIFFLKVVYSNSSKCLANPLVFASRTIGEDNNDNLSCSCKFDKQPDFIIQVNKDKWWVEKLSDNPIKLNLDWSSAD